jgi:hypothetical protein
MAPVWDVHLHVAMTRNQALALFLLVAGLAGYTFVHIGKTVSSAGTQTTSIFK